MQPSVLNVEAGWRQRDWSQAAAACVEACKVLVVENDPDTRANLRDILELDGYQVEAVAAGHQAMSGSRAAELLAVLVERRCPDGGAHGLLCRITQMAPAAEVVIATGRPDSHGSMAAVRQGGGVCPAGPIGPDQFKDAEPQAPQAERLAALGQMSAVLAHEGRNLLQRIMVKLIGLAALLVDQPDGLALVTGADQALHDLARLFDDVRGYAGEMVLRRQPLDFRAVWRQAWEDLKSVHGDRDAELVEPPGTVPANCTADPFRLGQVFRNLFENALAACADPVRVRVGCTAANCQGRPALRLTVTDNGPGIPPDQRQKVFEPFYTTRSEGTGLGLAIVRRIIEAHGGQITLGRGAGGGAEFAITLPLERA